ncbi:MAG: DUF3987 domain-containing protein [Candidatus Acidoferrales bacterium]
MSELSAQEFFNLVWPQPLLPGETLELRVLRPTARGVAHQDFLCSVAVLIAQAQRYEKDHNVYFGVAIRRGRDGTKAGCRRTRVVWVDIDKLDKEGLDSLLAKLRELQLSPHAVVKSGGGYHLYWQLAEPLDVPGLLEEIEAVNRGLADVLGGDRAATDVSRILRIPGFLNYKYDPPRPVTAARGEAQAGYRLADFKQKGIYIPRDKIAQEDFAFDHGDGQVVSDPAISAEMRQLLNTPGGDSYGGDRSKQDMAVVAALARADLAAPDLYATFVASPRGKDLAARKGAHRLAYLVHLMIGKATRDSGGNGSWVGEEPEEEPAPGPVIPFPTEGLVGLAADFARLHAENLEAPVEAFYFSYLTMLGAALSRHARLATSLPVQPRLYTVLLGASATAKKSTAISFTDRFFQRLRPGRVAGLFADGRPPPIAKPPFKTIYGLGSAEGIARAIKEDGLPLLLCFDELKVFVDKTKQEGSVGLPMINILFEQNNWDNYTVKKTIALRDASLSFLAASTTATFESMWTSNYLDIGFLNRLLTVLCARTRRVAFPRPLPQGALEKLAAETWKQITTLTGRAHPTVFTLDRDAEELWREWYVELEDTLHARRLDAIGMRLLLLLAVTTGAATVTRDLVDRVIAILAYELRVRRLTDPIDAENAIAKLEEAIRRSLRAHPGQKLRQLQGRIHAHRHGIWAFNAAFKNLKENQELHVDRGSKTVFPGPGVKR